MQRFVCTAAALFLFFTAGIAAEEAPQLVRKRPQSIAKPAGTPLTKFAGPVTNGDARYVLAPLTEEPLPLIGADKRARIGTVREFPFTIEKMERRPSVSLFEVESPGAARVRIHFQDFELAAGVSVSVCATEGVNECHGPYESRGPLGTGEFWTPPVTGDTATVQIHNHSGAALPFRIPAVSHSFIDPAEVFYADPKAGACNLTVPAAWEFTAASVAGLDFIGGADELWCTGTLMNTQASDWTPYVMTANHCLSTQSEAQSLRLWWRFESGTTLSSRPRSDVATLLSTSNATSGTDYTLLMVLGALPEEDLTWSGWTTTMPTAGTAIVGLHHPNGDGNDADAWTRYSQGTAITACPCAGGAPITCANFVSVDWDTNGGVTEPGSSGSGIWRGGSGDPRFVGQLWGGCSACGNPNDDDHYGRFDLSYNHIGSLATPHRLSGGTDDGLENNDTLGTPRLIGAGSQNNLIVKYGDEDYYRVSVPANTKVTFTANFTHAYGDIDVDLYQAGNFIDASAGVSNSEVLEYSAGTATDVVFRVYLYGGTRNTYNLNVAFTTLASATVTLATSDNSASEPGSNTGAFTITRTGSTASSLTVNYAVGGTAGNGGDYNGLSGSVVIPGGSSSAQITVSPINDFFVEAPESVIVTVAPGAYVLGAALTGTVTITDDDLAPPSPSRFDLDASNHADIVWRQNTGATFGWLMSGAAIATSSWILAVDPAMEIVGQGDFDGDNKNDLLWRNANSGVNAIWFMNGLTIRAGWYAPSLEGSWRVVGIGDLDANGTDDIVWNSISGANAVWFVNGASVSGAYITSVAPAWRGRAVGDFNRDGRADLVWQNPNTGEVAMWLMNGATVAAAGYLPSVTTAWTLLYAADLDGDNKDDLIWRNTSTGENAVWFMNGLSLTSGAYLISTATSWVNEGTGDFNNDGRDDLLWRNTSLGQTAVWFMNGASAAGAYLPSPDSSWKVATRR